MRVKGGRFGNYAIATHRKGIPKFPIMPLPPTQHAFDFSSQEGPLPTGRGNRPSKPTAKFNEYRRFHVLLFRTYIDIEYRKQPVKVAEEQEQSRATRLGSQGHRSSGHLRGTNFSGGIHDQHRRKHSLANSLHHVSSSPKHQPELSTAVVASYPPTLPATISRTWSRRSISH